MQAIEFPHSKKKTQLAWKKCTQVKQRKLFTRIPDIWGEKNAPFKK